tara:strand:+ start:1814 stop:2506 length:693 start_codon:yes stop_codon:yes gene_type:complete
MVLKKIFLTGGSGTLGSELIKISKAYDVNFVAPLSNWCDIRNPYQIKNNILDSGCDTVVHTAALTNVPLIEEDPIDAYDVNVLGTINIIKVCKNFNKKLVFISTDYVFDGQKGNYKTTDPINPLTKYAKTKGAAELLVRTYENSLIIRTSFFGYEFPYDAAFVDQWSSKDYIDIIAPKILKAILDDETGIVHIGNTRRSIYEIAQDRTDNIAQTTRSEVNTVVPKDTSFA